MQMHQPLPTGVLAIYFKCSMSNLLGLKTVIVVVIGVFMLFILFTSIQLNKILNY